MKRLWLTLIGVAAVVAGTVTLAVAQPCHGKIISVGDSKWEVQDACGEPSQIEEATDVLLQSAYDNLRHVYVQIPVYVTKSIWTYNFGPTSLIYILTFRENKLDKIETGGYSR